MQSFAHLHCASVAIRSSATCEDSEDKAWAGQLDTFLNVNEKKL